MGEAPEYAYDEDYDENDCWNCGGEGFVSNCFQEFACMYPDEGCDDCTKPCDVCRPRKNPAPDDTGSERSEHRDEPKPPTSNLSGEAG